jgi:hypothetical protein
MLIEKLDRIEKSLQTEVRNAIRHLEPIKLDREVFFEILLQREWLSYFFTGVYDIILNRLSQHATSTRATIRQIIREEYPDLRWPPTGELPSHREDLVSDLLSMGMTEDRHRKSWFTSETKTAADESIDAIHYCLNTDFPDVSLIAYLRFWGEVLTAVEYKELWPRIRLLLGPRESKFYLPHIGHDEQQTLLAKIEDNVDSTTHADELGKFLARLVDSAPTKSRAVDCAEAACRKASDLKINFYRQFRS